MTIKQYKTFQEALNLIDKTKLEVHGLRFNKGLEGKAYTENDIHNELWELSLSLHTIVKEFRIKHYLDGKNRTYWDGSSYVKP